MSIQIDNFDDFGIFDSFGESLYFVSDKPPVLELEELKQTLP